jgi:hypothetical protein
MLGYKILENESPFPNDKLSAAVPFSWKVAEGLARGLSVETGCEYVHMVALASLSLNTVKTHYSGILGIFPNVMINLHGASGDGKSIPLWMDTQILHYLRKKILKKLEEDWGRLRGKYNEWVAAGKPEMPEGQSPPVLPGPKPEWEVLYDKGSIVGLGVQIKDNDGRAYLIKHEGKQWLIQLLSGGPAGSMDDLNAIAEHAFFKNAPANKDSKFRVENPHVIVFILTHMEEMVPLLDKELNATKDKDSVAGLARFLYGHFKPMCSKVLPEGSPDEIEKLIQENDEYFNDILFDEAVTCVVNILLVMDLLYQLDVERVDEKEHKEMFSELTGLHTLSWGPAAKKLFTDKFNASSDKIKEAFAKLSSRIDASGLSKDKTRLLQLLPPVELMEKTIAYLMAKGGHAVDASRYSPEEVVKKLAELKIDKILKAFRPEDIPSVITDAGVQATDALAAWFSKQGGMLGSMQTLIDKFKIRRKALARIEKPRAAVVFLLAQDDDIIFPCKLFEFYKSAVAERLDWDDLVYNPDNSDAALKNAVFQTMLLALCGLVVVQNFNYSIVSFAADSPAMARACARLEKFDPDVVTEELVNIVPKGALDKAFTLEPTAASALIDLLVKYGAGEEITAANIEALDDPFPTVTLASQAASTSALGSLKRTGAEIEGEDANPEKKVKKKKSVIVPSEENLTKYVDVVTPALKYMLASKTSTHNLSGLKSKFATSLSPTEQDESIQLCLQWLKAAGLGSVPRQNASVTLMRPAVAQDIQVVANSLAKTLKLEAGSVKTRMEDRVANDTFTMEDFRKALSLAGGQLEIGTEVASVSGPVASPRG